MIELLKEIQFWCAMETRKHAMSEDDDLLDLWDQRFGKVTAALESRPPIDAARKGKK